LIEWLPVEVSWHPFVTRYPGCHFSYMATESKPPFQGNLKNYLRIFLEEPA
jgi:hypothetical protein